MTYAALWCKSNFSFLEGSSHPEELVEACSQLGIERFALTDRDGVYGIVEAHVKARELGVGLIIGAEITVEDGSSIVLLAMNREGYANLCELITVGRRRSPKGGSVVTWSEVCAHAVDLIALWGGDHSLLVGDSEPLFVTHDLCDAFGDRLYALAARHHRDSEMKQESRLRERAKRHGIPIAAGIEVLYHSRSRRELQDVLTCVRNGVTLSTAGCLTRPNAEHVLKSPHAVLRLFEDDPGAVALTQEIAERCRFSLDEIRYRYPLERLPEGTTSSEWLRQLTFKGATERFADGVPDSMRTQIEKELDIVEDLDYGGYFLTMWEIVQFCRKHGILCQGRGSAANSAVCYCLGITAVDPVRMGLLFERFLSRERAEPPDIDLDIEHDRREEVIQYVYEKYGRSHAAMVANIIRYRARSAVREVGKALGLDEAVIDRLAKLLSHYGEVHPETLAHAGLDPDHDIHAHLVRLSNEILDFPRHLSIHPGGFLLGHEPVSRLVPIENGAMADRTVVQWDKDSIEELGLFKVDLLGLGALTQLHLGFDLLRDHCGKKASMASIPKDDRSTFEMICRSDTVGVFQLESRAQMAMLPRLKPQTYYDLVIEVSIVRPGPITGGMVHPYLRRRGGEEEIIYPHKSLEPVLKKTLGVPLFQEQVIRLAMVAADYTPGEADQLRRDMAAWRKTGRIERHRARLVRRMMQKGIAQEFAERVFEQIRGFGEYGFPESHAASFALISYATAWMKCHYPDIFTASLLNAWPMGFYSPATIIEDAKRHDIEVRPIDALKSCWDCTLELASQGQSTVGEPERSRFAVRVGLRFLKGMRKTDWEKIARSRRVWTEAAGDSLSIEDFAQRTGLEERALMRLAESGALSSLQAGALGKSGDHRRAALWSVRGASTDQPALGFELQERQPEFAPLEEFEAVSWDYTTTGLSPRSHPLAPLRDQLRARRLPDAQMVRRRPDGSRIHYAGLVICRQRPGTASGVLFMTLEDETGFVNLVVWTRVFDKNATLIKTTSFLGVTGKMQVKDGVAHIIVERFWKPNLCDSPEQARSRDFQ